MAKNPSSSSSSSSSRSRSSHESTSELERVFNRFDANGDGRVSASELADVMRALGCPPSADEVSRMMTEMDSDGDGFVDLKEFVEFYGGGGDGDEKEIREAFEMYDQNKDGKISAKELHRVLKGLGDRCSVEDCSRMIRSVDSDGDGSVNFEEFKEMMSRGKRPPPSSSTH